MNIPFTIDQFLKVFEQYNTTVWPVQILLYLFAVLMIIISYKKVKISDKLNSGILAFFWIWTGVVYHLLFFTGINKAAYVFGALFIIQGILFIYAGVLKGQISFKLTWDLYGILGAVFIAYALIVYPVFAHFLGQVYPKAPTFGLPCPTTIFTFGMLLQTNRKVPVYILVIPLIWSIIGFSAAVNLAVYEDFGLVIAGIVGTILILIKNKSGKIVAI